MLNIVIFPVNGEPEVRAITGTLKEMQEIVGGYIEAVSYGGYTLWCNEEGIMEGLPFNRYVGPHAIVGTFFVSREDNEGEMITLNRKDIEKVKELFAQQDTDSL